MNHPDRRDWYTIRLMAEVIRFREAFMEKPKQVSESDLVLKFERPAPAVDPVRKMTKEEYSQAALSLWRGMLGIPDPDAPSG